MKYIKLENLIVGAVYIVEARNFSLALWDGEAFHGIRNKFGQNFVDKEFHWDSDPRYGTAKPIECLMDEKEAEDRIKMLAGHPGDGG